MLAEYLSIQLFRTRMGNVITEKLSPGYKAVSNFQLIELVVECFNCLGKVSLNDYEKQYIDILFASAAVQMNDNQFRTVTVRGYQKKNKMICEEMLEYLSEILNVDLMENELLRTSMESFLPASLIRTTYGIEVSNPFLGDIRAVSYTHLYEEEQRELKTALPDMETYLETETDKAESLQRFIDKVKRITEIKELTSELVHEFIDKIVVHAPRYLDGKRVQLIDIYYSGVGILRELTPEEMEEAFQKHMAAVSYTHLDVYKRQNLHRQVT